MTKWQNFWHWNVMNLLADLLFSLAIITIPLWWPVWFFFLRDKTAWYDRYGEKIDVEGMREAMKDRTVPREGPA